MRVVANDVSASEDWQVKTNQYFSNSRRRLTGRDTTHDKKDIPGNTVFVLLYLRNSLFFFPCGVMASCSLLWLLLLLFLFFLNGFLLCFRWVPEEATR